MPTPAWLQRILEDRDDGSRTVSAILFAILALYVAGFLAFYPRAPVNEDETRYLYQAQLFLEGRSSLAVEDPLTGETEYDELSPYPVGTAVLVSPLVALAGRGAAYALPCLALVAAIVLTARWLRDEGHSRIFALLVFGFPASLVLGRVVLSDVPSMALVALGLWLFWRGQGRGGLAWLASGFVAGASITVRPTNAVFFAFFFAGTVLRRERRALALVAGGLAGLACNGLAHAFYFGDPFYVRGGYVFSPETFHERLPLYLLGLLVLFPAGLAVALDYRGRRRPELVATVVAFFLLFLFQAYGNTESGFAKRVILALRYFCPMLPILAFASGEALPRWWRALLSASPEPRRRRLEVALSYGVAIWVSGLALAAVLVHVVFDRWTATQAEIQASIREHTTRESVVVLNYWGTRKHLDLYDRHYKPVDRDEVTAAQVLELSRRHGEVVVVFLDRSDSEFWRADARRSEEFLAGFEEPPPIELDLRVTPTDRLRIWRVAAGRPSP